MSEDILTYRSLNGYLRERFGKKLYKLALDGGFSCPNRDGTLGKRGCSFCLEGSGSFSSPLGKLSPEDPEEAYREAVFTAIESAKARVEKKQKEPAYIAYFQRYTGTYAPYRKLEKLYTRYGVSLVSLQKESEIIDKVVELFERHKHENIG